MDEEKGFVAEELVLKLQKIGGFERFLYALPMRDGNTRYGCLLLFDWGEGAKVWSEASPLEGWSVDSLEEVQCWGIGKRIPPSLRFAIEAAWLIYRCWEGWDQPLEKISLCGLVEGHPRDWVRRVSQLQKEGCSVIKLKVRPEIMHASVEAVRRIRMLLGDKVELRLDANRSFTKEEAIRFAEEIKDFSISFIEEPCRNVEDFDEIYYRTGVRIGLDETLREITPHEIKDFAGVSALVLKPTLIGGAEACRKFAVAGADLGISSIVSGSYESGVGTWILAQIAARLPMSCPAGLDTYTRLRQDVLLQPLVFPNWTFDVTTPMPRVDVSRLDR